MRRYLELFPMPKPGRYSARLVDGSLPGGDSMLGQLVCDPFEAPPFRGPQGRVYIPLDWEHEGGTEKGGGER